MRKSSLILWLMIGIVLLQSACESPVEPGEEGAKKLTRVHGIVLRTDNLSVVGNAVVHDVLGRPADTSKTDGTFTLNYELATPYTSKIVAKRLGFGSDTTGISLVPGRDTSLVMRLKADTLSPPSGVPGKAANIVLLSATDPTISVRGTGGNETATMLFEVRDSLGVPVGASNKVLVNFVIEGGPGGGEYVFPVSGTTDALTGRISTKISSGTRAGVVQLYASSRVDTTTLKSRPVRVVIAGGFPEAGKFSIAAEKLNTAALLDNVKNTISAAVVDKFGNPVSGVAVYFTTTSGDIDAGGATDQSGRVSAVLRTSGPRPSSGIATVTAKTVGDSGISISKSMPIVFSMQSRIIAPTTTFVIPDSGEYAFTYRVQDVNGQPLSDGTKITVTKTGAGAQDVIFLGDSTATIPDTQDPKWTNFSLTLRDTKKRGASGEVTITIKVTSANGDVEHRFSGTLLSGGFPTGGRLSMSFAKVNTPAVADNVENTISVAAVDQKGNPVADLAVGFSTTSGDIDPGGVTDKSGRISSTLRTSGARPANGITTVTASVAAESGGLVTQSGAIVFSGAPLITGPTASFILADSGQYAFNYRVQDSNGHPLSAGTKITVVAVGDAGRDLKFDGDADVTLPDTQDPKYTSFSAVVRDTKTGGPAGDFTIEIRVAGANGSALHKFTGTLQSAAGDVIVVPPSAREPAQIAFGGVSSTAIDIAGVGGLENAVITYIVKDSLGKPIDAARRVYARFAVSFFPNSYVGGGTPPRVIPPGDSTDNNGQLRASIVSGTQAGVIQLVAEINMPDGRIIRSEPVKITVRAGDPTQSHFTFYTNSFVFATAPGSLTPTFYVQLADTFSNPVAEGTAVYFHSWSGAIQGNINTDRNGRGQVNFLGGNPLPTVAGTVSAGRPTYYQREGVFWVVAQSAGKGGKKISDSLRVVWATGPIVITGIPTSTVTIPRGGASAVIGLTFKDSRGNPLPVGTGISIKLDYFTSEVVPNKFGVSGDLSQEFSFVMPNGPWVVDPGPGITDFNINLVDISPGGAQIGTSVVATITINAPNIGSRTVSFNGQVQ